MRYVRPGSHAHAAWSPIACGQNLPTEAELRCVIGVIRHGDRSPKQKLKTTMDYPEYMAFFDGVPEADIKKELKVCPRRVPRLKSAPRTQLRVLRLRLHLQLQQLIAPRRPAPLTP